MIQIHVQYDNIYAKTYFNLYAEISIQAKTDLELNKNLHGT